MVQKTYVYRAMWPLLIGVLAIAAWDGAAAWGLCAAEPASPKHCAEKTEHSQHQIMRVPGVARLATAIQNAAEPCSHCLTHSPWGPSSSSRAIVPNNVSPAVAAADSPVAVVEFSTSNSPVAIYDHGPPGNGNHRYILISSFRI